MTRSRLLLILTVVLALAIYYAWTATPEQKRAVDGGPTQNHQAGSLAAKGTSGDEHLDFTGGEKLPYNKPTRDLFRALYQPPKPQPRPVVVRKPPPPPPPRKIIAPPPPVVVAPPPGPKPIPALKVLGFLQKDQTATAFLASPQGDIYVVKQGQRFADDLLVRELAGNKIVISRDLDDPGRTLSLGGAKLQRIKVIGSPSNRPNIPTMQELDANTLVPENAADKQPPGSGEPGVNPADQ